MASNTTWDIDCFVATKQLLRRDEAIAASRQSNELSVLGWVATQTEAGKEAWRKG